MLLKFRRWCLDKLVLRPSTNPIDFGQKQEFKIPCGYHHLLCYSLLQGDPVNGQAKSGSKTTDAGPDLLVIKWPGNAGRAENSGPHPAMAWPEKKVEIWTINPFGYGGSSKSASLSHLPEMAAAVLRYAFANRSGVPVLLVGNSIGCATAIYQAVLNRRWKEEGQSNFSELLGLLLINPPPLVQLIPGHYHRPYYGPVTKWLATATPDPADSVRQARKIKLPCFLLQCHGDQIVPAVYQNQIFDSLDGEKLKWVFGDSDHNSLPDLEPGSKYLSDLREFFKF